MSSIKRIEQPGNAAVQTAQGGTGLQDIEGVDHIVGGFPPVPA